MEGALSIPLLAISFIFVVGVLKDFAWHQGIPIEIEGYKDLSPCGMFRMLFGAMALVFLSDWLSFILKQNPQGKNPFMPFLFFSLLFFSSYLVAPSTTETPKIS